MGRAKTEKFPMFAGFSLDPKTNKMSAGYIIGISIKPSDFGLTGGEDNATMAAAVVRSLEAQGAAAATARAEAAEQRAEALEREVARLRADRAVLMAAGLVGSNAGRTLPSNCLPMLVRLSAEVVAIVGSDDREALGAYVEALLLAEAHAAGEVSDG